jgi:hypothetical protein
MISPEERSPVRIEIQLVSCLSLLVQICVVGILGGGVGGVGKTQVGLRVVAVVY